MQQQDRGSGGGDDQEMKQNQDRRGLKPPPVLQGTNSTGGSQINQQQLQLQKCPRCDSLNTKFCYYNNYSLSQPRYFCKTCRRYWTQGGTLRNVPVGGGCRKAKRAKTTTATTSTATSTAGISSSQQNPSSSVLMSTLPALRSPIISSVGTYNPVGGGGGFLSSLAAIHQQSLSNQPSQLSFVNQAMTNFGVNLGSSNLGQVLLHGFPSQQQQRQEQFYNMGIRDDNTHRDHQHQHQFYPHDQESLIQSSTNLAANSQNWHQQAAFVSSSSTNPTDTTLWSTISTSVAGGHSTTTTTTTNAIPTIYGGPSLNLDPWQHDHLSGYGPPS